MLSQESPQEVEKRGITPTEKMVRLDKFREAATILIETRRYIMSLLADKKLLDEKNIVVKAALDKMIKDMEELIKSLAQ